VVATANRRAQERARRKADILTAARAVFAQSGFQGTTVEAVAERAEVGKGTIYLYFESKEALRAELLLHAIRELTATLKAASDSRSVLHPEQRLRGIAEAYLAFAHNSPDYFRLLNSYDRGDFESGISSQRRDQLLEASRKTLEIVTQPIADGIALGLFAPGDPRTLAGVLWAAINGALGVMAHPVRRNLIPAIDAAGLCRLTVDLFLRGIAAHP